MKLPVFATIKQAYGFFWVHRSDFCKLALPAIIIVSLSGAIFAWGTWMAYGRAESFAEYLKNAADPEIVDFQSFLVLWLLAAIVFAAVFCMYAVSWHRLYLVPGEDASARGAYRWGRRQWRFLLSYIRVFLIVIPIFIVPVVILDGLAVLRAVAAGGGGATLFVFVFIAPALSWLIAGWFYARFSMLFPAMAVDAGLKVRDAWRLSKGNGWRLLWIIVFVALPVAIVTWPVNFGISVVLMDSGVIPSLTANLLTTLIGQFFAFIGIAVGVSALSISYKLLVEAAAAQAVAGDTGDQNV